MKIDELMTKEPKFCTPDDSVIDCAKLMTEEDVGAIPICESRDTRRAIGMITDRDIVVRVVAEGKDPHAVPSLREVMTGELITCSPNDDAERARELMKEHQLHRILVVDELGSLVGVVALADLAREFAREHIGEAVQSISKES